MTRVCGNSVESRVVSKRIIICCDGTWKRSDDRSVTNVVRINRCVLPTDPGDGKTQIVFYDPGVGTGQSRVSRVIGGAFGEGLEQNVFQAYGFLVDNFEPDDELFLFGFSRGAFTARSVAGMIRHCGILRKDQAGHIREAYAEYRARHEDLAERRACGAEFRRRFSHDNIDITFIGVWDTVGSLGIPGRLAFLSRRRHGFHDVQLSSWVKNACHALAIDERRGTFKPTLWEWPEPADQPRDGATLSQTWFAGVHSDVGGGYATEEGGLANLSLEWMASKAEAAGLAIDRRQLDALINDPAAKAKLHNSSTGLFRFAPSYIRPIGAGKLSHEDVSPTAIARHNDPKAEYRPRNLVEYLARTAPPSA